MAADWPWAAEDREVSSTLRRRLRGSILPSENRGATVIRAHKAQLRRAERETAWLPALLVWTWVRAHRQLHAGNAGLRPATTNFPYGSACVTVVSAGCSAPIKRGCAHFRFSVYTCRSNGVAHTPKRALL